MINDLCIFIISCKKNFEIVKLCVQSINYYSNIKIPIYISMDKKINAIIDYENVSIIDCFDEDKLGFGNRICNCLGKIKHKYILVMCDDFIVEKEIDINSIKSLISTLHYDKKISSISLAETSGKKTSNRILGRYLLNHKFSTYNTTLQAAIWNKTAFSYLMEKTKSPWEFELFSNFKTYLSINKFYSLENDKYQPLKYNRGKFVIRGKIVTPEKNRLEKVLGRDIFINGFEYTNSYEQEANIAIFTRIIRRLKLYYFEIFYRIFSMFYQKDINIKGVDNV